MLPRNTQHSPKAEEKGSAVVIHREAGFGVNLKIRGKQIGKPAVEGRAKRGGGRFSAVRIRQGTTGRTVADGEMT